jgi:hypothetical protein
MTIYITPKQKETIDVFLKYENAYNRFEKMADELKLTSANAVRSRVYQMQKKGLFAGSRRKIIYTEKPFVVQENPQRKIRKEKKAKERAVTNGKSANLTGKKRPLIDYIPNVQNEVRIDHPTQLNPNQYQNGKLIKVGLPKFQY